MINFDFFKITPMKHIIIALSILVSISACDMVKAPEFKGISKIDLKTKANGQPVLVAFAKFHNPNLLGGKFEIKDLQVFVNDKFFANINADTYKVPSKKDFEVPMEVDFDKAYFKKNNLLDALNNLFNNKMKVKYTGKIYYVSHKLHIPYNVDYEQDVKLIE